MPEDAPSSGPQHAKVPIVEWSDFECHYCGHVNSTLAQLKEKYGEDVRVVFRHQPMFFHPNARLAAEASMAAHEQGRFWEYHDQLFAHQRALDRTSLERYAQELKLNMGRFRAALDSGKFRLRVENLYHHLEEKDWRVRLGSWASRLNPGGPATASWPATPLPGAPRCAGG